MTENTQESQNNSPIEDDLQSSGAAGSIDERFGELEAQLAEAKAACYT